MTYTYSDNGKSVTNVYNARDSHAIAQFISQFNPSIVKKETSGSEQHKAFVIANMDTNPVCNNFALAKAAGIR